MDDTSTTATSSDAGAAVKSLPTGPMVLLGPQTDYAEIRQTLDELDVTGKVALITTGWQENELEDDALVAQLGRPTLNLALHARSEALYVEDPDYAAASSARQQRLRLMQQFYRVRLDSIDDAAHAIGVRHVDRAFHDEQLAISVAQFQHIDAIHLDRCQATWRAFDEAWPASARPELMRHRDEIAQIMAEASAVVISGGHIGSLLNRLRLFDVLSKLGDTPVVAWSAGAMVLTDCIVLAHDTPPFGKNIGQVLDVGLGFAPGVIVLPDTRHRVKTDEREAIARFVQRMAPRRCFGMNPGAKLIFKSQALVGGFADMLTDDGAVIEGWRS